MCPIDNRTFLSNFHDIEYVRFNIRTLRERDSSENILRCLNVSDWQPPICIGTGGLFCYTSTLLNVSGSISALIVNEIVWKIT
jgi:hypothetical protein